MVVFAVNIRVPSPLLRRRVGAIVLVVVSIRSCNQRGILGVALIMSSASVVGASFTAQGLLRLGPASLNDLLSEASRMDLHVFDAREAGVPGVARLPGPTRLVTVRIARDPRASFLSDRAVLITVIVLVSVGVAMRMSVVAVDMAVIVVMVVIMAARSVGVAMSAENDETNEVRGKTKRSNN